MLQLERRGTRPRRLRHRARLRHVVLRQQRGEQVDAGESEAVFVARAAQRFDQLAAEAAAAAASPAASSASIRLPTRDRRMAAALPVEREQAAAAAQRLGGVAAHAGEPLRGLGAPEQPLRRPRRILDRLQSRRAALAPPARSSACAAALAARHSAW